MDHLDPEAGSLASSKPTRRTAKSRNGCLTCRHRKKKCDETRPICRDCARFDKECIWVDYNQMSMAEISRLKLKVRAQESDKKLRKRKTKPKSHGEALISDIKQEEHTPQLSPEPTVEKNPSTASPLHVPSLTKAINDLLNPLMSDPLEGNEASSYPGYGLVDTGQKQFQTPSPGSQFQLEKFSPKLSPRTHFFGDVELGAESSDDSGTSPVALFQFLKEVNQFDWEGNGGFIENETPEPEDPVENTSLDRISSTFSIPSFIEQIQSIRTGSPEALSDMASSFNAAFTSGPQPSLSFLNDLDNTGLYLYTYYSEVLSKKVSIAPHSQHESNAYQKVFLPLAQKDPGVLYGILAWAGFHLGGKWMKAGSKYAEMAVKCLTQGVDFHNSAKAHIDRKTIVYKLAACLILCGAEICRGDVKFWSVYLSWCWKLLKDNGGILGFNNNKEEHWLISNFAYHDLLASPTSERGLYFPIETYHEIFTDSEGVSKGNLNPLLGVCKFLFEVIGDINKFSFEIRQFNNIRGRQASHSSSGSDSSDEKEGLDPEIKSSSQPMTSSMLVAITTKARELEETIDNAKPESDDLMNLSDSELELQLTTFEAFQLSCKLYLRQSILKLNPSAIECQVLVGDLIKCIDILIDTPMQATLVFPMFIAGLFTVTEAGKDEMRRRFDNFMSKYGSWSLVRVKSLLETLWANNPEGNQVVDWNRMLRDLGWVLNFA